MLCCTAFVCYGYTWPVAVVRAHVSIAGVRLPNVDPFGFSIFTTVLKFYECGGASRRSRTRPPPARRKSGARGRNAHGKFSTSARVGVAAGGPGLFFSFVVAVAMWVRGAV